MVRRPVDGTRAVVHLRHDKRQVAAGSPPHTRRDVCLRHSSFVSKGVAMQLVQPSTRPCRHIARRSMGSGDQTLTDGSTSRERQQTRQVADLQAALPAGAQRIAKLGPLGLEPRTNGL